MTDSNEAWDPVQRYCDVFAAKVAWTPLSHGGATLRTHRAVALSRDRFELRATGEALWFAWFCIAGPIVPAVVAAYTVPTGWWGLPVAFSLAAVLFLVVGVDMLASFRAIRFDRVTNQITRPAGLLGRGGVQIPLTDVYAVQVVPVKDSDGVWARELNVVLKDSSRISLIAHTRRDALYDDADAVARFVEVPLWISDQPIAAKP